MPAAHQNAVCHPWTVRSPRAGSTVVGAEVCTGGAGEESCSVGPLPSTRRLLGGVRQCCRRPRLMLLERLGLPRLNEGGMTHRVPVTIRPGQDVWGVSAVNAENV